MAYQKRRPVYRDPVIVEQPAMGSRFTYDEDSKVQKCFKCKNWTKVRGSCPVCRNTY